MPNGYTYSDFDKGLSVDSDGSIKVLYDEDVILQSIRTIMATVSGERVRSPFGGSLVRYLFEPMGSDTAEAIGYELRDQIERFEPRVEVLNIKVLANFDTNTYDVRVVLNIKEIKRRTNFQTRLRSLSSI